MRRRVRFLHRGLPVEIADFDPATTVLDWLRLSRRLRGTKEGCAEGDCGACTVVLRRLKEGRLVAEPANACILLLGQLDEAELITVEDLSAGGAPHPVQEALVTRHGSQCGFCTPGIVMSLFALHQEAPRPLSRETVADALAGNLCRCTGYRPIIDAALESCAASPADRFAESRAETLVALRGIADGADVFVGSEERFFAAPARLDSACDLLARHPDALILAGATDVGLWVTKQLQDPPRIVWLGRIAALRGIEETDESLRLGAMVSHSEARAPLASIDPDLGELMRRFGSAQVRALGTVGGNIANGSPIGDLAPALIALEASLHLRHSARERTLPLENFFLAYRRQDREAGELVTALQVPKLAPDQCFRALKLSKRFDEDISAVMMALRVTLAGERILAARLAYGGMAGTPARARAAEAALTGASLAQPAGWSRALDALADDFTPLSDMRASSAYRMAGARALLKKALLEIAGADSATTRLVGRRPEAAGAIA